MKTFDEETSKYLGITQFYLQNYFAHSEEQSESLISSFFNQFSFDEDDIHYRHAYEWAVIIHFVIFKGLPFDKANDKTLNGEFSEIPEDAIKYFAENYFDSSRQGF
ncbi:MAG: hypothetical protein ACRBG0_08925 [Lewinella sp.]|uniref:hypothetical protein n=1 Tax=Lewinella sp. TaxID=2004506 RepID=UPI003D6B322D